MKYGIRFDINQVGPDTISAFRAFRAAGMEVHLMSDSGEMNPILNEAVRVLAEQPELKRALSVPKSVFEARVASSGAQACSSANDPSGQLD